MIRPLSLGWLVLVGCGADDTSGSHGPGTVLRIQVTGSGAGVVADADAAIECASQLCYFDDVEDGQTVTLRQTGLAESQFTGWTGCTANSDGTCTVVIDGETTVTATYDAPPSATWVRGVATTGFYFDRVFALPTSDGIVVIVNRDDGDNGGAPWIERFRADGSIASGFFDDDGAQRDRAVAAARGPGDDLWLLIGSDRDPEELVLHRVRPSGELVFSATPGGDVIGLHGLAVDDDGNAYVSGLVGTTPFIAWYSPSGDELGRITPPAQIIALDIAGDVLAAAGTTIDAQNNGWVGRYQLDGTFLERRLLAGSVVLDRVAIDSGGDVIYGGASFSSDSYLMGTTDLDPSWEVSFVGKNAATLVARDDATVHIWVGHTSSPQPSNVIACDDLGNQTSSLDVPTIGRPGGLVIDASGTYLAGADGPTGHPVIIRRP